MLSQQQVFGDRVAFHAVFDDIPIHPVLPGVIGFVHIIILISEVREARDVPNEYQSHITIRETFQIPDKPGEVVLAQFVDVVM